MTGHHAHVDTRPRRRPACPCRGTRAAPVRGCGTRRGGPASAGRAAVAWVLACPAAVGERRAGGADRGVDVGGVALRRSRRSHRPSRGEMDVNRSPGGRGHEAAVDERIRSGDHRVNGGDVVVQRGGQCVLLWWCGWSSIGQGRRGRRRVLVRSVDGGIILGMPLHGEDRCVGVGDGLDAPSSAWPTSTGRVQASARPGGDTSRPIGWWCPSPWRPRCRMRCSPGGIRARARRWTSAGRGTACRRGRR